MAIYSEFKNLGTGLALTSMADFASLSTGTVIRRDDGRTYVKNAKGAWELRNAPTTIADTTIVDVYTKTEVDALAGASVIEDTVDPTVTDDSYDVGTTWVNTSTDEFFICTDNTASAAVWSSGGVSESPTGGDILYDDTFDTLETGFCQTVVTITDGVTPSIDLQSSNHFKWTLTTDRTFPDVTIPGAGTWLFEVYGDYTLSFHANFSVYGDFYDGSSGINYLILTSDGTSKNLTVIHSIAR